MTRIRSLPLLCFSLLGVSAFCRAQAADAAVPSTEVSASQQLPATEPVAEERTPTLPRVSCREDQLLIIAEGSMMSSILTAVRGCIGVAITLPEGVADSRSYVTLGPGPMREVLDSLLSATDYDYVIESSSTAPKKIEAVVLMARNSGISDAKDARGVSMPTGLTMTPARRAWLATRAANRPAGLAGAQDEEPQTAAAEPEAAVAPAPAQTAVSATATSAAAPVSGADTPAGVIVPAGASDATLPSAAPKEGEKAAAGASGTPDGAPAADPNSLAQPTTSGQTNPATQELQNKINSMQQMFEQRKKMNGAPNDRANPN